MPVFTPGSMTSGTRSKYRCAMDRSADQATGSTHAVGELRHLVHCDVEDVVRLGDRIERHAPFGGNVQPQVRQLRIQLLVTGKR